MIRIMRYFSIVILFSYCSNNSYNISWMSYKVINFNELPKEVQQVFNELEKYDKFTDKGLNIGTKDLICLDTLSRYELHSIPTKFGPWTKRKELRDIDRDVVYKLKYNTPTPLIIYNNNLYLSTSYNYLKASKKGLEFKLIALEKY